LTNYTHNDERIDDVDKAKKQRKGFEKYFV
jgi:hypothetical protein